MQKKRYCGGDNEGYESCIERHGMGDKNDNGERLCDFSVANGLVITGILFQHKDIHEATWVSANSRVKNKIDHLLISRRLKSAVLDTRVQSGPMSTAYLVRTRIRLKLRKYANMEKFQPMFNADKLRDRETKRVYCGRVGRRLEENRGEEREEVEELWEALRKAYVESAEEVLGFQKGKSKEWISQQTWKVMDERKEIITKSERIRKKIRENYKHKREDKRMWMTEKAQVAQTAAENGRAKEL